jgi:hypothetical protein
MERNEIIDGIIDELDSVAATARVNDEHNIEMFIRGCIESVREEQKY